MSEELKKKLMKLFKFNYLIAFRLVDILMKKPEIDDNLKFKAKSLNRGLKYSGRTYLDLYLEEDNELVLVYDKILSNSEFAEYIRNLFSIGM